MYSRAQHGLCVVRQLASCSTNSLPLQLHDLCPQVTNFTLHPGRCCTHKKEAHGQKREESRSPPFRVRLARCEQGYDRNEGAEGSRYPMTEGLFHIMIFSSCYSCVDVKMGAIQSGWAACVSLKFMMRNSGDARCFNLQTLNG